MKARTLSLVYKTGCQLLRRKTLGSKVKDSKTTALVLDLDEEDKVVVYEFNGKPEPDWKVVFKNIKTALRERGLL